MKFTQKSFFDRNFSEKFCFLPMYVCFDKRYLKWNIIVIGIYFTKNKNWMLMNIHTFENAGMGEHMTNFSSVSRLTIFYMKPKQQRNLHSGGTYTQIFKIIWTFNFFANLCVIFLWPTFRCKSCTCNRSRTTLFRNPYLVIA